MGLCLENKKHDWEGGRGGTLSVQIIDGNLQLEKNVVLCRNDEKPFYKYLQRSAAPKSV